MCLETEFSSFFIGLKVNYFSQQGCSFLSIVLCHLTLSSENTKLYPLFIYVYMIYVCVYVFLLQTWNSEPSLVRTFFRFNNQPMVQIPPDGYSFRPTEIFSSFPNSNLVPAFMDLYLIAYSLLLFHSDVPLNSLNNFPNQKWSQQKLLSSSQQGKPLQFMKPCVTRLVSSLRFKIIFPYSNSSYLFFSSTI